MVGMGMCSLLLFAPVFAVMCFCFLVPVHSSFITVENLVLINHTEGSTIPTCPSRVCFYNKGIIEGAVKYKLMFMYVWFV